MSAQVFMCVPFLDAVSQLPIIMDAFVLCLADKEFMGVGFM